MPAIPPQVLLIGAWRVDPALGEIVSGRRRAKLDPLPMRLLLYLADNAGRVVAVQELLDAVWPDVLVTPQSVYNTVAQLRAALGDEPATPDYIVTVPRRGYRLVASVRCVPAEPAPPAPPATQPAPIAPAEPAPAVPNRSPARGLLAALLIVLVGTGLFAVLPFRDLSAARDHAFLAEGLTEEIGSAQHSPHGLRITAALIQTATGQYLWSKTFDRATDDYYSVEDEIADEVAEVLTKTRTARSNTTGLPRAWIR
jgi:DNA-binding winged helix-turn-helix (wHTH) protein